MYFHTRSLNTFNNIYSFVFVSIFSSFLFWPSHLPLDVLCSSKHTLFWVLLTEAEAISPLPAVSLLLVLSVVVWITIIGAGTTESPLQSSYQALYTSMFFLTSVNEFTWEKANIWRTPPSYRQGHWGSYSIGLLRESWNVREGGQSTCCQGLWPQVLVFSDPDTTNPPILQSVIVACFEILSRFSVSLLYHLLTMFEEGHNNSGCCLWNRCCEIWVIHLCSGVVSFFPNSLLW